MFAVVRHPDIDTLGIIPQASLEAHRGRGFYRVSEWRSEPADFHLPDYAGATRDLDAPEPADKPAKTTSKEKSA